jgi:glycine cleavage system H lipoate-binding protein
MGKVYTSMRGKEIDMEKMSMRFEKTPAVGNMKVNARGDEINDRNQVIRKKPEQVNSQYGHQTQPTAKK